jgi:tetratricopeptide (TPR) repeat protein
LYQSNPEFGNMKTIYSALLISLLFLITTGCGKIAKEYYNHGNIKSGLEDYMGAIIDYTKAIEIETNLAVAYFRRGGSRNWIGTERDGMPGFKQSPSIRLF